MRPLKLLVAAVVVALVAGCSTTETQTLGASDSDAEHVITIAAVPGQNIRLLYVPEVEEIFAAHNVQLEVTEVRRQDVVESEIGRASCREGGEVSVRRRDVQ